MFQVRFHGRGGQGSVTAAEVLSVAAFLDGRHAQAFPSFGSERTGAPVISFCRIDDVPIRTREPIARPDVVVIQDPTLLHQVDVFGGLAPGGRVLINSAQAPDALGLDEFARRLGPHGMLCVPATDLARAHLGRPLPNAVLLGALSAFVGLPRRESLDRAIRERFPGAVGDRNVAGAAAAFRYVRDRTEEPSRA